MSVKITTQVVTTSPGSFDASKYSTCPNPVNTIADLEACAKAAVDFAVAIWKENVVFTSNFNIRVVLDLASASGLASAGPACLVGSGGLFVPITVLKQALQTSDECIGNPTYDIDMSFDAGRSDWHMNPATAPLFFRYDFVR